MKAEVMAITNCTDILLARRLAKDMSMKIGFNPQQQEEIVLVVSELASNLVKYAGRGVISLEQIFDCRRTGIAAISRDNGPGFDPAIALADGYSSTNTLGCGLGAVNRLVDELNILTARQNHHETYIACKKWLPVSKRFNMSCPFDIGVFSRPKPGQTINGDDVVIKHGVNNTLIAAIDGLGHGASASKAASAAKQYVQIHSEQSLPLIFQGADRACLGMNGVVMALARFNWSTGACTFASIGNIESKVVGGNEKISLPVKRGIVGRNAPIPKLTEIQWQPHHMLIMHSDGVSSKWSWSDFSCFNDKPAQVIAEHMHRTLQQSQDDATLIIVKAKTP